MFYLVALPICSISVVTTCEKFHMYVFIEQQKWFNYTVKTYFVSEMGVWRLECPVCGLVCRVPAELRRHMCKHTGHKPFTCLQCGKGFSRKTTLNYHMVCKHGDESNEMTSWRIIRPKRALSVVEVSAGRLRFTITWHVNMVMGITQDSCSSRA